jgi:hypothetical protein
MHSARGNTVTQALHVRAHRSTQSAPIPTARAVPRYRAQGSPGCDASGPRSHHPGRQGCRTGHAVAGTRHRGFELLCASQCRASAKNGGTTDPSARAEHRVECECASQSESAHKQTHNNTARRHQRYNEMYARAHRKRPQSPSITVRSAHVDAIDNERTGRSASHCESLTMLSSPVAPSRWMHTAGVRTDTPMLLELLSPGTSTLMQGAEQGPQSSVTSHLNTVQGAPMHSCTAIGQ